MRLLAISDLHVRHRENREALQLLRPHPDDWLILAGDLCETTDELAFVLDIVTARFARALWVPGNHELWTTTADGPRGEAKYQQMVEICRARGVATPEDPFLVWPGAGGAHVLALLFLLYDYTFRPSTVAAADVIEWAKASGVMCADELYLHPDPYPSREAWCSARCAAAAQRLEDAARASPLILINHYPLRSDLADVPRYPRFKPWCGTTRTEDWHLRYRASVVVSGHLHIPSTRWIDGVRFEEVSFGYPQQRLGRGGGIEAALREILPGAPGVPPFTASRPVAASA
jgi:predicted phosphodiesterase